MLQEANSFLLRDPEGEGFDNYSAEAKELPKHVYSKVRVFFCARAGDG